MRWRRKSFVVALLWATGIAVASPGRDDGVEPQGDVGIAAIVGSRVNYQGRLEGATGPVSMTFRLWSDATSTAAGDLLWEETKVVTPTDGLFHTQLGDTTGLPQSRFNGQDLWLGVEVEGDGEMTPRQEILPVPYAMSLRPGAIISDTSSYVRLNHSWAILNPPTFYKYGVYAKAEGAAYNYGVYGSGSEAAIYGYGDVKQNRTGNGLVKAAVYVDCQ